MRDIPLHTLSCVDTCVPSSIVCKVKSISGTGFFSVTARSICAILIESLSSEAQSARFCVLRDRICDRLCLPLRWKTAVAGFKSNGGTSHKTVQHFRRKANKGALGQSTRHNRRIRRREARFCRTKNRRGSGRERRMAKGLAGAGKRTSWPLLRPICNGAQGAGSVLDAMGASAHRTGQSLSETREACSLRQKKKRDGEVKRSQPARKR